MKRHLTLIVLASFGACSQPASPKPPGGEGGAPPPASLTALTPEALDAFVSAVVRDQHAIGVTVGVMQNGTVIFAKGYGLANTKTQTVVTPATLFAVGSVTKQFTCSVALQLEQEHKLSFDDRVAKYAPSLTRAKDITIRDLGNHVSGYRDYYPLDFVDRPMAKPLPSGEIVKAFASRPLDFEPGSRYSYSNTGYLLLGEIIEKTGGEPMAAALERRIFKPLALTHTRYEPKRGETGLAEGYTPLGLGAAEPSIPEGEGWIGAAGGIWSTPTDLLAWDLALMEGRVLSPASWKTMTTPRPLTDGRSSGYGCGQSIRDRGPTLYLEHSGGVSGFNARNVFIPASKSGFAAMANADWSGGVLNTIQSAVLAKLMPAADAPTIAGKPAKEAALDLLTQIRANNVDRSQLGEEFNAFLAPERLAAISKSLVEAGEVSQAEAGSISERGGMEVSTLRVMIGSTPAQTLMYRTPDGKVQEFLVNRR
jgi:CubicO group peptidase (beta-lactamase class C family)